MSTLLRWLLSNRSGFGLLGLLLALPAAAAPLRLQIERVPDGSVRLDWNSRPGVTYQAFWRSNLIDTTPWLLLGSIYATTNAASLTDVGGAGRLHPSADLSRFYRVREGFSMTLSNDVDSDSILSVVGSPYLIARSIRVRAGAKLLIEPGVTVMCAPGVQLTVEGGLCALGTASEPILFTSTALAGRPGDWDSIRFLDSSVDAECVLSNVVIEFARVGTFCQDASPQIVSCEYRSASQYGLQLERASPLIRGCVIERNGQDGIYASDQSSPLIWGNKIRGNTSDGVEFTGFNTLSNRNSQPHFLGNEFDGNGSFAVRSLAPFRPAETVIEARSNWWGTADPALIGSTAIYDYTDNPNGSPVMNIGNWLITSSGPPAAGRAASGALLADTSWGLADSPVSVFGHLTISSNVTLTIQPGVQIHFYGFYHLDVFGTLQALGSVAQPVQFTSGDPFPLPGDWESIRFFDSSPDASCVLSNVVVEFAQRGVSCLDASPRIVRSVVAECSQYGFYLERSSPLVEECVIERHTLDGLYLTDACAPLISRNQILRNGSDGLEFTGFNTLSNRNSRPRLMGNSFIANGGFAVRALAPYRPAEFVVDARSNWWGTADPALIGAVVYDYADNPTGSPLVNVGNWYTTSSGTPAPGSYASGPILADTTWKLADSPVAVFSTIVVASNVTLTIEAGVEVRFHGLYRIDVSGALRGLGSAAQPVRLTSGRSIQSPGDWEGVRFLDGSLDATCVLSNTIIEFARTGVACVDASPALVGSTIRFSSLNGIQLDRSSPLIEGCTVERNAQDGIVCNDASSPLIKGNHIQRNTSYGVEITGVNATADRNSKPRLVGNTIEGNGTFAVRALAPYRPTELTIDARSNWWGTAEAVRIAAMIYDYTDNPTGSPVVDIGNWSTAPSGGPAPGRALSGFVLADLTWTAADSPISIFGNVTVGTNVTLTIGSGVEVRFFGFYRIDVFGALRVSGTPGQPVVMTGGDVFSLPGDWEGLRFLDSSLDGSCLISNAVIEFARTAIFCQDASPRIVGCTITDCSLNGIQTERGSPLVQQCDIDYNGSDGLSLLDASMPQITGCRIFGNGSDGIEFSGASAVSNRNSRPTINGCQIYGNAAFAVRSAASFRPAEQEVDARFNWWGTVDPRSIATDVFDYTDSPTASPVVNFGNWQTEPNGPTVPGKFVSGLVFGVQTWRASDAPLGILGPVQIVSNAVLNIEAGIPVTVYGNYRFDVAGTLKVNGRAAAPVNIGTEPGFQTPGAWPGVRFLDGSVDAECVVSNLWVSYAVNGFELTDASPKLYGCRASRSSSYGMLLTRSSPVLDGCAAVENRLTGIYCTERSSPTLTGSLIATNGGDGLYCFDRSSPLVTGCIIRSNAAHGVELVGASAVTNRNSEAIVIGGEISLNRQFGFRATGFFRPAETHLNARSNWWGTADPIVIAQQVYDFNDEPNGSPVVDYGNWAPLLGAPPTPGTYINGPILGDTTWSAAASPVSIIGHLLVHSNASLVIEPGVEVLLLGNYRFDVDGGLQAAGGLTNAIVFTSGRPVPAKSDWPGIKFTASSTNRSCLLSNVVVEFADRAINCLGSSPRVAQCQVRQNNIGISLDTSASWISGSLVELNDTAIYCFQWSAPLIEGNTITLSRNNGIEVVSSTAGADRNPRPLIVRNSIFGNGTAGGTFRYNLYAATFFQPASNTVIAVSNWWGTTDTNLIDLALFDRRDNAGSPTVSYVPVLTANSNFVAVGTRGSSPWISPNGDGTLDDLTVDATMTHNASWDLQFVDSTRRVRRHILGSGTALQSVWDGSDDSAQQLPEGRYRAVVFTTNSADGRVMRAYGDAVRVDRSKPIALASIAVLPDGKVANDLSFVGTAADAGALRNFILEYGAGASPTAFSILASNNAAITAAQLALFDSRTLNNGTYSFRLTATDYAGNVTVTQLVVVVDNLLLANPSVSRFSFDPPAQTARVEFNVSHSAAIRMIIRPVSVVSDTIGNLTVQLLPRVVAAFDLNVNPGPVSIVWDGYEDNGRLATNGTYIYEIFGSAALGRTNSYDPEYVIGLVTVTNLAVGTNFNFAGNEPMPVSYTIQVPAFVGIGIVPYSTFVAGAPRDAGSHVEYIDGRDPVTRRLISGQFQVNVKAEVMPENSIVIDSQGPPLVASLQSESWLLIPTFSGVSEIRYVVNALADVEIRMRDPNGNLLTLLPRTRRDIGSYAVEWAGVNGANQVIGTEGDYEVLLSAINPFTGEEQTRSANLSLRR